MKGQSSTVSAVVITAVTLSAVGVVLNVANPAIDRARDASAVEQATSFMNELDDTIRATASEGEGSTRTVSLNFDRGEFYLNATSNTLSYNLETAAEPISPQSRTEVGDVILASNADVTVKKATRNGKDCYLMENQVIEACIRNNGTESSPEDLNTTAIVTHYEVKDDGTEIDLDPKIELNNLHASSYGTGYTEARELGTRLSNGEVIAHVSSANGFQYRVLYEIYSGSDFLSVRVLPE